ncbi:peptidyl-prolyl cis-trans isomerase FKBP62-like [Beta vulgaris subsp. vulgaris]|uniref:peptidyl-prolyl cis-trans isomerase FKBP62-like n=1 Tax=Beta vulgaris subsp. vulgaris TaxID=3555 RepID=UPI00053FA5D8|nr:peptidyl-prolyl cis-trans isomerase FKBP62-like [Beta vulgaris subsp. vulgaris]
MFSLEVCETLKGELHELLNKDCNLGSDDNKFLNYVAILDNPKTSSGLAKSWKEEGNSLFSHGDIDDALEYYGFAGVMLSLIVLEEEGAASFCELAFYILLNLAACFLKKNEFDQVGLLCYVVLTFDPCNVKALFRRAKASVGIRRCDLAYWDLLPASKIDPSNKEIAKKLNEV